MLWLVLAIGAQTSGALAVHLDKIALDNYVKGFETTFVFAALFNGVTAVVLFGLTGTPSFSAHDAGFAVAAGALFIVHLLLYFAALQNFSALSAAVFYQLTPVFGLGLAALARDSSITVRSIVAIAIVTAGSVAFSVLSPSEDGEPGGLSFGVLKFMLPSAASLAASAFLLDRISGDASVAGTILLSAVGSFVFGAGYAHARGWIGRAVVELRRLPGRAWPSVGGAELLALAYQLLLLGALLSGPVAFVLSIEGVQPLILLIIGVVLSFTVPHLVVARPTRTQMIEMVACSAAILAGVALLATQSVD